jgi:hypothetical protein
MVVVSDIPDGDISTYPEIRIDIPGAQNDDRHRFSAEETPCNLRGWPRERTEIPFRARGGPRETKRKRPVVGCTVEETGGNPYGTNRIGSLRSPMTCGEGLHTGNFERWDELP